MTITNAHFRPRFRTLARPVMAVLTLAALGWAQAPTFEPREGMEVPETAMADQSQASETPSKGRNASLRKKITTRSGRVIDPKTFESRGRALRGVFYEMAGLTQAPPSPTQLNSATLAGEDDRLPSDSNGKSKWLVWTGLVGIAGAGAAYYGFQYMQDRTTAAPVQEDIWITDKPTP